MSRNARKYCLQRTSCPTGFLDIFIYFIFDILLCVLVGFYNEDTLRNMNLITVHFWTYLLDTDKPKFPGRKKGPKLWAQMVPYIMGAQGPCIFDTDGGEFSGHKKGARTICRAQMVPFILMYKQLGQSM